MFITVTQLISEIGYSTINVINESPLCYCNNDMEIDHISLMDNICHFEGSDGNFFEIPLDSDVEVENGEYHIRLDSCHICIKLIV